MIYYLTINNDYRIKDPGTGLAQVAPAYIRDGRIQDASTRIVFRNGSTTRIDTDQLEGKQLPVSLERMIEKGILKVVKREKPKSSKKNDVPIETRDEVKDEEIEEEVVDIDYSSMLKKDLKAELDQRGIEYDDADLKDELVALLEKDDNK